MGHFTIAAYRPRPGKDDDLAGLVREHHGSLRGAGLVTERRPYVMKAGDGTLIEVFEWMSADSSRRAHESPAVQAVFCLDVRSEIFRRALEAQGDDIQTLSCAGFFGLPVEYAPLAADSAINQVSTVPDS